MGLRESIAEKVAGFPPPEVATAEDVERYNIKYYEERGIDPTDADDGRLLFGMDNPYGDDTDKIWKIDGDTKQKAEFPWTIDPPYGVRWDFDPVATRQLAQPNTWVGTLVQSIVTEVSQTPWQVIERDGERLPELSKRLNTHPEKRQPISKQPDDVDTVEEIERLIFAPNPDDNTTDLLEMWMSSLLEVGSLTGVKLFPKRSYATIDVEGRDTDILRDDIETTPSAILPSPPEVWTKDFSGKQAGITRGYWQFGERSQPAGPASSSTLGRDDATFFSREEIIWNDLNKRDNRNYGMPPTLLVEDFLQNVDLAITQEQNYFARGSIPASIVNAPEMNREEAEERHDQFTANIQGKPHKLAFMNEPELNVHDISHSYRELEFTERVKWYAKVIASAFQVPTAVVGLEPEKVNYNTFQGERENFEANALGPYLQELERVVNHQLIWPHWGMDYRFEFQPGVSESTRAMISERKRAEVTAGISTPNEARREIGLEPSDEDGADTLGPVDAAQSDDTPDVQDLVESVSKAEYEVGDETLDLTPPEYMVSAAEAGQEARDRYEGLDDCGTGVGNERARQIINDDVGPDVWGEIASYLTSHYEDVAGLDGDYSDWGEAEWTDGCGTVQFALWGGTGDGRARDHAQEQANKVARARGEQEPYYNQ